MKKEELGTYKNNVSDLVMFGYGYSKYKTEEYRIGLLTELCREIEKIIVWFIDSKTYANGRIISEADKLITGINIIDNLPNYELSNNDFRKLASRNVQPYILEVSFYRVINKVFEFFIGHGKSTSMVYDLSTLQIIFKSLKKFKKIEKMIREYRKFY